MKDIFEEIRRKHEEMNRLFDEFFSEKRLINLPYRRSLQRYKEPLTNITQDKNNLFLNLEMPGLDKQDINLEVTDHSVRVKGEKKQEVKFEKDNRFKHEFSYLGFFREIPLPTHVDANKTEAEYKNGILHVKIPKLQSIEHKTKKIEIK